MQAKNAEELANFITHAIGIGLSIAALALLIVQASFNRNAWQITGVSIYGATLVLLYLASTFYHGTKRANAILQTLDHASIYLLIAGTYTPFTLTLLRGGWGWALFGILWGLAAVGIAASILLPRKYPVLRCALYLAMGRLIVIALVPVLRTIHHQTIFWLLTGGLLYSGGVVFFASRRRFAHTVWHMAVLGGSICHFFAVLTVVHQ